MAPRTYGCADCDDRKKKVRNCRNLAGCLETILKGRDEWITVPASLPSVEKFGDLKFYACPISTITSKTWEIIRIVNSTISGDGDVTIGYVGGGWLDQPLWYRQAVEIIRNERAAYRKAEIGKRKNKG